MIKTRTSLFNRQFPLQHYTSLQAATSKSVAVEIEKRRPEFSGRNSPAREGSRIKTRSMWLNIPIQNLNKNRRSVKFQVDPMFATTVRTRTKHCSAKTRRNSPGQLTVY